MQYPSMKNISSRTALGTLRAGVGVISLIAPVTAARAFGVDPDRSSPWITRLFGSRELVLAASLLASNEHAYHVAVAGALIDSFDVLSTVVEHSRGRVSAWTVLSGGAGAALFVGLGVDAARRAQQAGQKPTLAAV